MDIVSIYMYIYVYIYYINTHVMKSIVKNVIMCLLFSSCHSSNVCNDCDVYVMMKYIEHYIEFVGDSRFWQARGLCLVLYEYHRVVVLCLYDSSSQCLVSFPYGVVHVCLSWSFEMVVSMSHVMGHNCSK